MTSIKAKLRASIIDGQKGVIYYQVIHNRAIRQIKTEYTLDSDEWNSKSGSAIINCSKPERAKRLKLINDKISFEIRKLYQLAKRLENQGRINHCDDLIFEYQRQPKGQTLFSYFTAEITRLKELHRLGTAANYLATFNSFFKFRMGEDLIFDNITSELMEEYEAYLKVKDISMNSSSFYMRILRALYNKAVDNSITEQQQPFKKVYTGVERTQKRALPLRIIKKIKEYDLKSSPSREYARDMFLFSFYTRGMSFVDMAHLRNDNISDGVLSYRRRKTSQLIHIKWEPCMQEIANRYHIKGSAYIFPIIPDSADESTKRNRYKKELCKINNGLKRLAMEINITTPLTMYVARHSWASAARAKNIPISVISEGMGHDNETTTHIYLASLESSIVDRANMIILKAL